MRLCRAGRRQGFIKGCIRANVDNRVAPAKRVPTTVSSYSALCRFPENSSGKGGGYCSACPESSLDRITRVLPFSYSAFVTVSVVNQVHRLYALFCNAVCEVQCCEDVDLLAAEMYSPESSDWIGRCVANAPRGVTEACIGRKIRRSRHVEGNHVEALSPVSEREWQCHLRRIS